MLRRWALLMSVVTTAILLGHVAWGWGLLTRGETVVGRVVSAETFSCSSRSADVCVRPTVEYQVNHRRYVQKTESFEGDREDLIGEVRLVVDPERPDRVRSAGWFRRVVLFCLMGYAFWGLWFWAASRFADATPGSASESRSD